jgi:hypothetical protein
MMRESAIEGIMKHGLAWRGRLPIAKYMHAVARANNEGGIQDRAHAEEIVRDMHRVAAAAKRHQVLVDDDAFDVIMSLAELSVEDIEEDDSAALENVNCDLTELYDLCDYHRILVV